MYTIEELQHLVLALDTELSEVREDLLQLSRSVDYLAARAQELSERLERLERQD